MGASMNASGIKRSEAENLFQNYHQSTSLSNSKGLLKVNIQGEEQAIVHFALGYKEVIKPLKEKVDSIQDLEFIGIAGLPAFNSEEGSHTMIWVAVVKNPDGKTFYFLPPDNDSDNETYLYDYIDVCPVHCPDNDQRLWNNDWAE